MTREEAIEVITDYLNNDTAISPYNRRFLNALGMAIEALSERNIARDIATILENEQDMRVMLQNVERPKDEWIPCSERLPKAEYGESDCVLATCCWKSDTKQRWIKELYFNGGNWCYPTGEYFTQKVIAWMPLPMPYREDGEQ